MSSIGYVSLKDTTYPLNRIDMRNSVSDVIMDSLDVDEVYVMEKYPGLRGDSIYFINIQRVPGRTRQPVASMRVLALLNLGNNDIKLNSRGREFWRNAGAVGKYTALVHLGLFDNRIGDAGVEFVGVLAQCPSLAHLNLYSNWIGALVSGKIRVSWFGKVSFLL